MTTKQGMHISASDKELRQHGLLHSDDTPPEGYWPQVYSRTSASSGSVHAARLQNLRWRLSAGCRSAGGVVPWKNLPSSLQGLLQDHLPDSCQPDLLSPRQANRRASKSSMISSRRSPLRGAQPIPSLKAAKDSTSSMVGPGRRAALTGKRNVSFNDVIEVEVPHIEAPRQQKRCRSAEKGSPEDVARANMSRLRKNHKQVLRGCRCDRGWCQEGWRLLGECAKGMGLIHGIFGYHAQVDGDVLLIGPKPGVFESAVILSNASVQVTGNEVTINSKDSPVCRVFLSSPQKASGLAKKVMAANAVLKEVDTLYAAAVHLQELGRGDTGGT